MVILVVVLLVLWAILAVIGFTFAGFLWLAIIAIILFIGTLVIALVRRNTVVKRARAAAPQKAPARADAAKSAGDQAAQKKADEKKAPTAAAQENEIVSDDTDNPSSNLE